MLANNSRAFQMTGSRYICDPPPVDTDEDYIVLMSKRTPIALDDAGFVQTTDPTFYAGCPDFFAWRGGIFNIICVDSPDMYARWVKATELAKKCNLLEKAERIALFQAILYGDSAK